MFVLNLDKLSSTNPLQTLSLTRKTRLTLAYEKVERVIKMDIHTLVTEQDVSVRGEMLAARLTTTEMEAVDEAANISGVSRSQLVRHAVLTYLQVPRDQTDASIESTILTEILGLRYLLVNLIARANPEITYRTLYDIMSVADAEKHAAAVRALTTPNANPTP